MHGPEEYLECCCYYRLGAGLPRGLGQRRLRLLLQLLLHLLQRGRRGGLLRGASVGARSRWLALAGLVALSRAAEPAEKRRHICRYVSQRGWGWWASQRGSKYNNTQATPPVHACSTLTMPPAHRRQLRPTGAERPGLTKQKQDRRHLARRRIAARERQLTAGGGRPPPTGRAPPPPPAPPPAASPRRAAATRTTATCAPTR